MEQPGTGLKQDIARHSHADGTIVAKLKYHPELHRCRPGVCMQQVCSGADPNKSAAAIQVIETDGNDADRDSFVIVSD